MARIREKQINACFYIIASLAHPIYTLYGQNKELLLQQTTHLKGS